MSPERAVRAWEPEANHSPTGAPGQPRIKLVPEIAGRSKIRALGWSEISSNALFRNMEKGLDFYISELLEVLTQDLEASIKYLLIEWSPDAGNVLKGKALRKIANSALAPGSAGFERTQRAWQEVLDTEKIIPILGQDATNSVTQFGQLDEGRWLCDGCDEEIKNKSKFLIVSPLVEKHKNTLWHIPCRITYLIREEVSSYRAAKSAIDKQSNSVRAILSSNEKKEKGQDIILRSRSQAHAWIDQLTDNWKKTTSVKEEFWPVYESNFSEYADRIIEYQLTGSLFESSIAKKLTKHLKERVVTSVVNRLSERSERPKQFNSKVEVQVLDLDALTKTLRLASSSKKVSLSELTSQFAVSKSVASEIMKYLEKQGILGQPDRNKSQLVIASAEEISAFIKSVEKINGEAPSEPTQESELITIKPTSYGECRVVGERFREGNPVIVDFSLISDEEERKRMIDFLSGLVFGIKGTIERVTPKIFLLSPSGLVKVSEESDTSDTTNSMVYTA